MAPMNDKQQMALEEIASGEYTHRDDFDGRTLGALERRNFVKVGKNMQVKLTAAGKKAATAVPA